MVRNWGFFCCILLAQKACVRLCTLHVILPVKACLRSFDVTMIFAFLQNVQMVAWFPDHVFLHGLGSKCERFVADVRKSRQV